MSGVEGSLFYPVLVAETLNGPMLDQAQDEAVGGDILGTATKARMKATPFNAPTGDDVMLQRFCQTTKATFNTLLRSDFQPHRLLKESMSMTSPAVTQDHDFSPPSLELPKALS